MENLNFRLKKRFYWQYMTTVHLPLRRLIDPFRSRRIFETVRKTRPFDCHEAAEIEIHSLTGRRHVSMYLLAIKSLLRFCRDFRIVVHDDGTLEDEDKALLKAHIKNIRVIDKGEADRIVIHALKDYVHCQKFRESRVITKQVFDFPILAEREKIIQLDCDLLFLKSPQEVLQWSRQSAPEILYTYEENPYAPRINKRSILALPHTKFKFADHLCGGFVCSYRSIYNLELIEQYCRFVIENCNDRLYRAQTITALCVAHSGYKPSLLPSTYQNRSYFGNGADPVYRHYWHSEWGLGKDYVKDAWRVLRQLTAESPAFS